MKKRSLSLFLCLVLCLSLFPTVALADAPDIWVNGTRYDASSDQSGTGWTWTAETNTLALNNYSGSYISCSSGDLNIILIGTNDVTVPSDIEQDGITATGDVTISGAGDLTVTVEANGYDGIYVQDDLAFSGSGALNVTATDTALRAPGGITLSGSGAVTLSGGQHGIYCNYGDVTISGSGTINVTGTGDVAIYFFEAGYKVLLEGTASPITLKTGVDGKAVFNVSEQASPVAGTKFNSYVATGKPSDKTVTYTLKSATNVLHIHGKDYTAAQLDENIDKTTVEGWSWDSTEKIITLDGYDGDYIKTEEAFGELRINVDGNSTIAVPDGTDLNGIYAKNSITLTGDGNLTVDVADEYGVGILCRWRIC